MSATFSNCICLHMGSVCDKKNHHQLQFVIPFSAIHVYDDYQTIMNPMIMQYVKYINKTVSRYTNFSLCRMPIILDILRDM